MRETCRDAPRWVGAAAAVIRKLPRGRYRAANLLGRRAGQFWARFPDDLGGLSFQCDLRDPIMREVCLTGRYEPQVTALLQRSLRPGMTCVDVGANWGYFTLAAAHAVGSRGRVIAVEADSIACTALRANLGRNRLAQVTVLEMAARERTGDAWMWHYSPDASDSRNFGLASTNMDGFGKQLRVRAGPLDEALDLLGVDRIDLLKMDIEGDEGRALTGLIRRLGPHHLPRILLELHPFQLERQGSSAQAVIEQLRRSGYHAWVIDHSASVTRQVAAGRRDASSTLAPLIDGAQLGTWPHVLFAGEAAPRFAKFEVPRPPIVKGAHVTPSARQVDEIIRTGAARDAAEQI